MLYHVHEMEIKILNPNQGLNSTQFTELTELENDLDDFIEAAIDQDMDRRPALRVT